MPNSSLVKCNDGWTGVQCDELACVEDCGTNGKCVEGKCFCKHNYYGSNCSLKMCPYMCNNNGICLENSTCLCNKKFTGKYCEKKLSETEL